MAIDGGRTPADRPGSSNSAPHRLASLAAAALLLTALTPAALAVPPATCNGMAVNLAGATDGDDNLVGTAGADVIHLGDGNDTFNAMGGNDVVCGGNGNDTIRGGDDNDMLFGQAGDDTLRGEDGNDTLDGGDGSDRLFGGLGDDMLDGGPDDDLLNGNGGFGAGSDDDVLMGGDGDDELIGEGGDNTLDGGPGTDLAFFVFGPVNASLVTGMATHGPGDTDTMTAIEDLQGSSSNDVLVGNSGPNFLKGGAGDDILIGGAGNDELRGDGGNDSLSGGPGDDLLDGQDIGVGCNNAVNNWDEADYSAAAGPIVASTVTQSATGEGNDTLRDITALRGSAFNDTLEAPRVNGGPGNDTLSGDEIDYSDSPAGVTVNLDTGTAAADGHGGTDTILAGWTVRGSAFNDDLTGPGPGSFGPQFGFIFEPVLTGGPGNDTLRRPFFGPRILADYSGLVPSCFVVDVGLLPVLYFSYSFAGPPTRPGDFDGAPGPVTVDLVAGTATGWGSDTLDGILGAVGSEFDDMLTGNDAPNNFFGMGGNDTITDGAAFDPEAMIDDHDFLVGGAGNDTIDGGAGLDFIAGEAGNDMLMGGDGNDDLNGGDGNNTLDGGDGEDEASYLGGATVNADLMTGMAFHSGTDTLMNIENLDGSGGNDTLRGDSGPNRIRGRFGNDLIEGRDGDDFLFGDEGNDTVNGGPGNDAVNGGTGNDLLIGGPGDDAFHGGSSNFIGQTTAGAGNDTVSYAADAGPVMVDLGAGTATGASTDTFVLIDNVIGTPAADTLIGDTYPNQLEGGDGADFIDGKGGADTMDGGAANDECVRDQPGDVLISCETETAGDPSGTIVIRLDAVPNDARDFEFTGSGGIGTFLLDDDPFEPSLPGSRSFANLDTGTYTITETAVPGWPVTSIACDDSDSTGNVGTRTATVQLAASEIVTCTFTNSLSDLLFSDSFE